MHYSLVDCILVGHLYYPWPNCDENATTLRMLKEGHPLSWENLFKLVSEHGVPPLGPDARHLTARASPDASRMQLGPYHIHAAVLSLKRVRVRPRAVA